jgi:hypothetical protein
VDIPSIIRDLAMKPQLRLSIPLFLLLIASACSDPAAPEPKGLDIEGPVLAAPSQLRACSDSTAIILAWTPSADEDKSDFAGYYIIATDTRNGKARYLDIGLDSSYRVGELENGVMYRIDLHCKTVRNTLSSEHSSITWSPARRRNQVTYSKPIRIYANTSTGFLMYPAADLWNPNGEIEPMELDDPAFRERASLYVHTLGNASALIIRSPELAFDPGPRTRFADWTNSGYVIEANSLNEQLASSPPDTAAYTATFITLPNGTYPTGRVYFGKLLRPGGDIYFRMLVKRGVNGRMAQGAGDNRYIEIEVSVQSTAGNHFAKRG